MISLKNNFHLLIHRKHITKVPGFSVTFLSVKGASGQTWKKTIVLNKEGLSQNYFTRKSECSTKQHKMYLTTSMNKIGMAHIY